MTPSSERRRMLRASCVKRIHVNRHVLARNARLGACAPAMTVQTSKGPLAARKVTVVCGCGEEVAVLDQAAKPLSCGSRLYVQTTAEVRVE